MVNLSLAQSNQGPTGPKGDTGPQGLKGDKGSTGKKYFITHLFNVILIDVSLFYYKPGSAGIKGDKGEKLNLI